jgi:hypothetical protein
VFGSGAPARVLGGAADSARVLGGATAGSALPLTITLAAGAACEGEERGGGGTG